MKPKYIFLGISLIISISLIAVVLIKGNPPDKVSLDSVSDVVESVIHHVDKAARIATEISDKEEMKVGNRMHKLTIRYRSIRNLEGSPLDKYVTDVGNEVAKNVKRKGIKYKFHIADYWSPNAYASPGGHIYVTIGLLKQLDSEAELAAILGHEIIHVDAKHAIGAIQYKIATEKLVGPGLDAFVDVGYQMFFRPAYSEVQEAEADLGGVYLAYEAGYHPNAVMSAFENIMKAELSRKRKNTITPVGDTLKAIGGLVGRYFGTHPRARERIDSVKRYIKDNKLVSEKKLFYIGQRNFLEKKTFKKARYKEEFKKVYILEDEKKDEPQAYNETVKELYTVYGRIHIGMEILKVKKAIPKWYKESERKNKIIFKNIRVYRFYTKKLEDTVKVIIYVANQKVRSIRIVKEAA